MATTADIKNGLVINFNGDLVKVIEFQHIKLGRGGARVWTKFKKIRTGQVIENTFRSGEKIDIVRLEAVEMQFLYRDGSDYVLMNTETFEQITVPEEIFKDAAQFIKENELVKVTFFDGKPIDVEVPIFVNLKVVKTEPGKKGDTVTGASKPAVLETGYTVQVPLFINAGDIIRIDTRSGQYCERVK
ncbi:MAG TPA: elongation factor P [Candidatus Marinimicrobia bacterium]|nr:elongation factor P [Candidatus Neomarinimicrobiota bacterium]HOV24235.1 elongation factor P [Candidatus Neomarinimicrobiota bacterium]HQE95248.1 elongation factor P [Candidatus Neomarinimicrobiota bacterium]HQH55500.1 elongation factor P [Candidatus Neomarinimicrobiota bacterium]HQK11094.1 elongation factor P [Candidatus Neomarinimicrobiota bacterium]